MMRIRMAGATDVGRKRKSNQDSIFFDETQGIGVVADGIGGRKGGEVASSIAVDSIKKAFQSVEMIRHGEVNGFLVTAIDTLNADILARGQFEPEIAGMGTTVNCLAFVGDRLHLAHIGDSRTYLYQDGQIFQLTIDHNVGTFAARGLLKGDIAAYGAKEEALVKALGLNPICEADIYEMQVKPGQIFITCSDGLSGMVPDNEIAAIIRKNQSKLTELPKLLISAANAAGGRDNITVLVTEIRGT
jgi:serine/threonine protein phosphatase PrpC